MIQGQRCRPIVAWAFYDFANSAFATVVIAGFFPIFFKQYWSIHSAVTQSTFYLGVANATASILIALAAPLLGAIADRGNARLKFLCFFATVGILMTAALFWVAQGQWLIAIVFYALANIGFAGSNIFYDALIIKVSSDSNRDIVSGLGFALGYLGGGLLFALIVAMTLSPANFGLASAAQAIRISFLIVAAWWTLFSIPLLLFVRENHAAQTDSAVSSVATGLQGLVASLRNIKRSRPVVLFLIAYWLYIDGVGTVIRMAVDFGLSIGFTANHLVLALLLTQAIGFPATLIFGKIGQYWGPKPGILLGLAIYMSITVWAFQIQSEWEFYVLACAVGLVQGGVQALSRSFYSRLIPAQESAKFFGFYNMLGKFAAVIGPLLVGFTSLISGSPRYGILAVLLLFVAGASVLHHVNEAHETGHSAPS